MIGSMAGILRNVIKNGGLPLTQVSERIETMYLSGRISGEERLELTALMHEKASPENEKGGWEEMYRALKAKYEELAARVEALETHMGVGGEESGGEAEGGYPAWEMWDGVSGGYTVGAIVTHGGKTWQNMLEGMTNVWEPGAAGVDERYWKKIDGEEAVQSEE